MARSTLSSRFRRLDIDQYDENRFVEEPEEAATAEPDAGPEVEALLRQYPLGRAGGSGRALRPSPRGGAGPGNHA
ncbi:actin-related protein 2/3 complex subunit 5-like protein [Grus japonensis]|uniref:Actin-related protein 2/3 complex subunit 5-like protein n=1 Tax=Grus japonensis TaxID=30415 RepID=A0ABC9XLB6_GRUJA